MKTFETALPGVIEIAPEVHADGRGLFMETYREARYRDAGIDAHFVQDSLSCSCRNTLRGLHYQYPRMQAKLCWVVRGAVLDVVVDIRRGSPGFGRWIGCELTEENNRQIYIPRGFAHGFRVLSETAVFAYKCDAEYDPQGQYGVLWSDEDIGIEWKLQDPPVISGRDRNLPRLRDIPAGILPEA